jgi:radical SAM protein with 4Fe4S-binding SPASM domain
MQLIVWRDMHYFYLIERILKNSPGIDEPTKAILRPLVVEAIESRFGVPTASRLPFADRISQFADAGRLVDLEYREGLAQITETLGNMLPLEILGYMHPDPSKRLQANRLLRKLDINVTEVCNYDCSYCYQRSRDEDWEQKASKADSREISLDQLYEIAAQANSLGCRRVKITGGEPLTKKGIVPFIERLLKKLDFEQVELCTNGSLISRQGKALSKAIEGNAHRFHIHTSIDGIAPMSADRSLTKASPSHLAALRLLLKNELLGISVSVNTMWNPDLLEGDQLSSLYDFIRSSSIERWTLSFPYFVKDFIEACQHGTYDALKYTYIVRESSKLVDRHLREGLPFSLSIPLVFKQEAIGTDGVSRSNQSDHPCFPCHGSFFVIGPEGDIFDCLLCDHSQTNLKSTPNLLDAAFQQALSNPFGELTVETVSESCRGCRYEQLCHGQCPSDRMNTNVGAQGGRFGRDKTACSLLPQAENAIWSSLPQEMKSKLTASLNEDGFIPAQYESPGAVARGDVAITPDVRRAGEQSDPGVRGRPAAAVFHTKAARTSIVRKQQQHS